jgi:hypothetical protein
MPLVGIAGVRVGLALVMPAVAQMRHTGALPTVGVGLLILGLAMSLGGLAAAVVGARRLRS